MDGARVEPLVELRLNGFGLGDFFRLEPAPLEHVEEVGVTPGVELIGAIDADASIAEKPDQSPMYDRRPDLAFDVVANDGQAGVAKLLRPERVRGDERGYAIDHGNPGIQARLGVMFHGLLRANRLIAQQDLSPRGA